MWRKWMTYQLVIIVMWFSETNFAGNFKITHKPCSVRQFEGTCMFVWECIKSRGQHVGMCVDSFMFGSCCSHNLTADDVILTQKITYIPNKPPTATKKPQVFSSKPVTSASGMTTILRPNGGGMLVVRPSFHKPNTFHTTNTLAVNHQNIAQNTASNSIAPEEDNAVQDSSDHRPASQHWQSSTQPSFVTNPRPATTTIKTYLPQKHKTKPSKKPIYATTAPLKASTTKATPHAPSKGKPTPQASRKPPTTTAAASTTPADRNATGGGAESRIFTISAAKGVECGISSMATRSETRIVGGKNAAFGRWPWQVSVRRTSFFGFSSTHRCGGAVLNKNWVTTAGHCVDDLLTSQIRIRVGEYDFSHVHEQFSYVERGASKKIVHPKYNFFTYEYDLALVRLESPLDFDMHISPICLPATDDLLIGENATVTGWGRLSEGGTLPTVLQEVTVPIVSNDRCKTMFLRAGRHEFIPEIFLCAGHDTGGQDSCQGDSGGPLQVKARDGHYFLAGIISWGVGCAEANLPGVCTRISKFVPWILENSI
ncbi:serine proteinase stubble isoform X2 [Lutzomyia longipalpis]|nr:serine proteinase stubble isoform X2 [Lutzomyia longipalpis]XP_055694144.1 serine proteinase stubble isoform X2 [Lutzomyia longipalpis]